MLRADGEVTKRVADAAQLSRGASRPFRGVLHDANGGVVHNDDWRESDEMGILATGLPPPDNREAAIVQTLAPGNYTAILSGKGNTTGVGLIEIYNLEPN